jgi:hypothetical protein
MFSSFQFVRMMRALVATSRGATAEAPELIFQRLFILIITFVININDQNKCV